MKYEDASTREALKMAIVFFNAEPNIQDVDFLLTGSADSPANVKNQETIGSIKKKGHADLESFIADVRSKVNGVKSIFIPIEIIQRQLQECFGSSLNEVQCTLTSATKSTKAGAYTQDIAIEIKLELSCPETLRVIRTFVGIGVSQSLTLTAPSGAKSNAYKNAFRGYNIFGRELSKYDGEDTRTPAEKLEEFINAIKNCASNDEYMKLIENADEDMCNDPEVKSLGENIAKTIEENNRTPIERIKTATDLPALFKSLTPKEQDDKEIIAVFAARKAELNA